MRRAVRRRPEARSRAVIAVAMLRLWPKLSLLDIGPQPQVNATSPAKFRNSGAFESPHCHQGTGQSRSPRRSWYCDGKEALAFVRVEGVSPVDRARVALSIALLDDEPWSRRANYGGWEDFPQTPEAQERLRALGFEDLADHYAKTPEQLT